MVKTIKTLGLKGGAGPELGGSKKQKAHGP